MSCALLLCFASVVVVASQYKRAMKTWCSELIMTIQPFLLSTPPILPDHTYNCLSMMAAFQFGIECFMWCVFPVDCDLHLGWWGILLSLVLYKSVFSPSICPFYGSLNQGCQHVWSLTVAGSPIMPVASYPPTFMSCLLFLFVGWAHSQCCHQGVQGDLYFSVECWLDESVWFLVLQFSNVLLEALQALEVQHCVWQTFLIKPQQVTDSVWSAFLGPFA